MKTILTVTAMTLLVSGCAETVGGFNAEAGSQIADPSYGSATMSNQQAMIDPSSATASLGQRFAAEVDSTVNFAFNSSTLDAAAQNTLRTQANWIRQFPEIRFRVYGHTDLVGSAAYNQRLGLARANAVVRYLTSQGISRSRLEAVASYGETRPVIATQSPEMRNRRTVTEVSGFVKGSSMLLNGKYAEVIFREYVISAAPKTTTADSTTGGGAGQ